MLIIKGRNNISVFNFIYQLIKLVNGINGIYTKKKSPSCEFIFRIITCFQIRIFTHGVQTVLLFLFMFCNCWVERIEE
jgi:hypothetical protein